MTKFLGFENALFFEYLGFCESLLPVVETENISVKPCLMVIFIRDFMNNIPIVELVRLC